MGTAEKKIARKTVKKATKKQPAKQTAVVRVNGKFVNKPQKELLVQHGYWDALTKAWTAKAASHVTEKLGLATEKLPEEIASQLKAARTKRKTGKSSANTMRNRLAPGKLFRLTDAERSQIIGRMIIKLQSKIGGKDEKSVTAEMIKLLQLEKEFAPKHEEQRPKRVAVVFVPPKEMHKYVLRKDAPRPELKSEE